MGRHRGVLVNVVATVWSSANELDNDGAIRHENVAEPLGTATAHECGDSPAMRYSDSCLLHLQ
jgi:hypothetical protein